MYAAKLDLDDLQLERQEFSGNRFYAHTKRIEVLLTRRVGRRLPRLPATVGFHSTHPGWVATPGIEASLPGFNKVMGPLLRDPAAGADTIVWLLGRRAGRGASGGFWHDRRQRPIDRVPRTKTSPDEERRLFDTIAGLCGVDPAELAA